MKLPVGSKEREEVKRQIELEIITTAEKWERSRAAIADGKEAIKFFRHAELLARLVRKWRKL